jgi:DNA invertase Pin-like site-specific DNA recombinase
MFGMLGIFAEFEREMIQARIVAGIDRVRAELARNRKFVSKKSGVVRTRLGRPGATPEQLERARQLLAEGKGILNTAKACELGTSTVHKLKRQMAAA